jgi:hypothetical protein
MVKTNTLIVSLAVLLLPTVIIYLLLLFLDHNQGGNRYKKCIKNYIQDDSDSDDSDSRIGNMII